ncbi:MAG: hypothetical protein ACKO7R_05120, partial [Pseudanabaena sp.]
LMRKNKYIFTITCQQLICSKTNTVITSLESGLFHSKNVFESIKPKSTFALSLSHIVKEDKSRIRTLPLINTWVVARNFAINLYRSNFLALVI